MLTAETEHSLISVFLSNKGGKKSSVRGAPDFSKYCLVISRQRWKRLHLFPSLYFIIHNNTTPSFLQLLLKAYPTPISTQTCVSTDTPLFSNFCLFPFLLLPVHSSINIREPSSSLLYSYFKQGCRKYPRTLSQETITNRERWNTVQSPLYMSSVSYIYSFL